jgi:hypothetical protein
MTLGEIIAMLSTLKNIQDKLDKAAGAAVAIELRMRLIAQLCEPVRTKIIELVKKGQRKKTR